MYFLYNAFFYRLVCNLQKKFEKNSNNWVNTKFVTKVFCKISRLSDLNYLQKFVGVFFVFSSWEKGGIPNASRKIKKKKKDAQLIYLYNLNKPSS